MLGNARCSGHIPWSIISCKCFPMGGNQCIRCCCYGLQCSECSTTAVEANLASSWCHNRCEEHKPNIIPEKASLEYYVRAPTEEELSDLREKKAQAKASFGSTDMGNVSHVKRLPFILSLTLKTSAANHTHEFTAASGGVEAHARAVIQAKVMANDRLWMSCAMIKFGNQLWQTLRKIMKDKT
ncbi:hypothetical protein OS493_040315 [Desmophyllum pertusum]|uniref:Uncharacterized protein n=1 Tax=Desmophyllum pertusum TaxID=174260 RepID=A0A9W9Z5F3_9CNID|nr:hypothetical protein OS493_040315 [Desmophyllum pertusum]